MKICYQFGLAIVCTMVFLLGHDGIELAAQPIYPLTGTKGEAVINEGVKYFQQMQWKNALTHFQKAVQINPHSAVAHYNLALTLERMGQQQRALKHFKKAKELGRVNPFIQQSRILQQRLQGTHSAHGGR
ncbi:MAG: tetratricopeptide repeat protein [Nitrospirae bacterium]|nr:MAG: tetratricopeptide repeat protein [Nitrospirota bacterium]